MVTSRHPIQDRVGFLTHTPRLRVPKPPLCPLSVWRLIDLAQSYFWEIMYPVTCLRSASGLCIQSRTEGFALFQFKMLYMTDPVTARVQSPRSQISPAIPLENLEQYGSDFGSSDNSRGSGAMPNYHQQCSDPNATSSKL
jgi:hypothetical protein